MPLTDYARDRFIAPRISSLTKCTAKPLGLLTPGATAWLADFVLNTIFRVSIADPQRQLMFTLLRRIDGALIEYEAGREGLVAFLQRGTYSGIHLYSRALLHFETCLALTYQSWCAVRQILPERPQLFHRHDGSEFERLQRLYSIWKHADEQIANGRFAPDSTLPVWLVNEGLESPDTHLTFDELADLLSSLDRIATQVSSFSQLPDRTG